MISKTIREITKMIPVSNDITVFAERVISGVSIDSRKIEQGNLFVPFKGEKVDGHKYVISAIEKGAAAAFWQKDVPNPPEGLPILIVDDCLAALQELARAYLKQLTVKVVGITGSNGKTTTKDMVTSLLSQKYKVQKTEGNYNNHIGLPLTVLQLDQDTEMAVLEMGMSARGEISFLTKLAEPDAVIITNIGEAHLLDLGSREAIAEAKLEILEGLKEGGLAVLNGDEPLLMDRIAGRKGELNIQTFGRGEYNDVYPIDIIQTQNGNEFTISGSEQRFFLPVLGTHNIINALSAMLIARHFSVSCEEIARGLKETKLTQMRMEMTEGSNGEKIINDAYNASPTSMKAAIDLVANLPGYTKKVLVLGDMLELGPLEEEYHNKIGETIDPEKVHLLFTFGELGARIAEGARKVLGEGKVYSFSSKEMLSKELKNHTDKQTLVLVKASRGMRLEEVVASLQKKEE
ncbi:UDP-N-acetylmuramoyl-tripeptide--D-alanyl-D-alanine ligase [Bacillus sp. FJAT-27225]|uniref:UDP-N-acetylmuramoyl-tripeptide--D-alanyl-D- alanine ligase n=1 Tax=Bacillus sp. FJAT-27225 TaxID=1743144 RepID=UPI00080C2B54|nr:UDP-N-acetylmuramoyl-tripeptide--D-alanyl-D-alanine ligase [Bacillus sp. FJAT-27225]OCA89342.1 UDP-N-acetylmuramoyl-tripeptide--D-alanyl-D-alanine ligase [Bacillus sp. FJAT-27225]